MNRHYHGTSHLGRCNIDALLVEAIPLRRRLEICLWAAENKMKNGLTQATGDMWTRGWIDAKEYRTQIEILDAATGG